MGDVFLVHGTHYCESQNSQSNNLTSHILIGDLMVAVLAKGSQEPNIKSL